MESLCFSRNGKEMLFLKFPFVAHLIHGNITYFFSHNTRIYYFSVLCDQRMKTQKVYSFLQAQNLTNFSFYPWLGNTDGRSCFCLQFFPSFSFLSYYIPAKTFEWDKGEKGAQDEKFN